MKLLLVILSFALIKVCVQTPPDLTDIREKCFTEIQLPENLKTKIQNFEYENDERVAKFIICVAKWLNVWDDTNGWNKENLEAMFDQNQMEEISESLGQCMKREDDTSLEDWAISTMQCISQSQIKNFFLKTLKTPNP